MFDFARTLHVTFSESKLRWVRRRQRAVVAVVVPQPKLTIAHHVDHLHYYNVSSIYHQKITYMVKPLLDLDVFLWVGEFSLVFLALGLKID